MHTTATISVAAVGIITVTTLCFTYYSLRLKKTRVSKLSARNWHIQHSDKDKCEVSSDSESTSGRVSVITCNTNEDNQSEQQSPSPCDYSPFRKASSFSRSNRRSEGSFNGDSSESTIAEYLGSNEDRERTSTKYFRESSQFCERKRKEDEENDYSFINMNSTVPRTRNVHTSPTVSRETRATYKVAVSNRKLIQTALRQNLLAGPFMESKLREALLAMRNITVTSNFVLLLNDTNTPMTLIGIYFYEIEKDRVLKIYGKGPKDIRPHLIFQFYRYDCGSRVFNVVTEPTTVKKVDAISLYKA